MIISDIVSIITQWESFLDDEFGDKWRMVIIRGSDNKRFLLYFESIIE